MIEPHDMYHVCWVVANLHSGMDRFGALGLRWATPVTRSITVGYPDGSECNHELPVTYSCDGPMYVELVEHLPGSVWEQSDIGAPHHVGFWSHDLRSSIAAAQQAGHTLEAWMVGDDGRPARFAYLRTATGLRYEFVDRAIRPALEAWMRGEAYRTTP